MRKPDKPRSIRVLVLLVVESSIESRNPSADGKAAFFIVRGIDRPVDYPDIVRRLRALTLTRHEADAFGSMKNLGPERELRGANLKALADSLTSVLETTQKLKGHRAFTEES